jgi:hypothetical protein
VFRNLLAAVAVFAVGGLAAGQPAPKKPDAKALVTRVYDLKAVLGKKAQGNDFADADAVLKVMFDALPALRELKPGTDGPQVVERDGGKLEVRAPADVHNELKDLIEAMERLTDLAVDVKAEVYELDAAAFDKFLKALPKVGRGKPGSPVLHATGEETEEEAFAGELEKALAELNKILKAARQVQNSTARFTNGVEATFAARQSVLTYKYRPESLIVKEGFQLMGTPVVSADRRFVRFKLTEKSVALTGIRKRDLGEIGGQKIVAESPELEDLGASGSAVVSDGGTAVFRLAYAPKDRVWLVVLRPRIFIQAEEDEVKRQGKK